MTKRKISILIMISIGLIILAIAFWFGVGNVYFSNDQEVVVVGSEEVTHNEKEEESVENIIEDKEISSEEEMDLLNTWEQLVEDDVSNWETYRGEEYGLEFRYPSGWQITRREKLVVNSDNYKMGLGVTMEKTSQNLNQFIEGYNSIDPISKIIKQEQISFNHISATKLLASTAIGINDTYLYFTTQRGINYLIKYNEFAQIHNEIISTLRLIN